MLVCACVLPAALVSAYLIYDHYQVERALLLNEALSTSRSMVAVVDRDFDTVITALRTLSASDDIDLSGNNDLAEFKRQAMQVHAILPVADIGLADPASGRQLMNTIVADGQPLPPPADPALVARVAQQGQALVSDLHPAGPGAAPFITVAVPVYRGGRLVRVLTARVPPATLTAILTEQQLPPAWRASITDTTGVVAARNRDIATYLGHQVNPGMRRQMARRVEGRFDNVTLDGMSVVTIYSRSPKSGWTVALGIPQHMLSAGLSRTLEALILATVVLLSGGLLLAWWLGGRVAASVQALIGPATALGAGVAPVMPQLHFREAAQVAGSLARAAAALHEAHQQACRETAERHAAEAALIAADRRKDEFLATLAHELRNPMAPLVNALEMLRMGGTTRAAPKPVLDIMDRQLKQMVHLVDDLLDVSRITTNKLSIKHEALTLQEVLMYAQETVSVLVNKRNHHLLVTLPAAAVYLRGDATRLAQVFANLLNNAAKYTPPGGTIRLTASTRGGRAVVTIADTGIGIAADVMPHIFEIFFQADQSLGRAQAGLGIGLPLARRLVELHDGNITVSSGGTGQGSLVTVELPVAADGATAAPAVVAASAVPDAAAPASDAPPPVPVPEQVPEQAPAWQVVLPAVAATMPAAGALPSHRVLLADDNVDNANTLKALLDAAGQQVQVSYDGLAALMTAEWFEPAYAFLDIGMPGLDGYELARRLRQNPMTQHSVLVAVTGWGQEKDQQQSREAGFDYHIVKPVRLEQLRQILAQPGRPAGLAAR